MPSTQEDRREAGAESATDFDAVIVAHSTLLPRSATWYMGANIPGEPRVFMPCLGGVGPYKQRCDEIAANDHEGFAFADREGARA